MQYDSRIFVAGGNTLIGQALLRRLAHQGYVRLSNHAYGEPDLASAAAVDEYFSDVRPEYVFFAAGRSGGISCNMRFPADLMQDNLLAATHVIDASHRRGVRKLLYLAASCIYPRLCPQPMRPEHLLTGPIEPTNEAYALAKLAGMKLCDAYRRQHGNDYIVGIPANAYGPGDHFDAENSHVIGGLIRRMHEAKVGGHDRVLVWGSGRRERDFIFADDLADACILLIGNYSAEEPVNLGTGENHSIRQVAEAIRQAVGYEGALEFDASKPDGMPLKALDSSVLFRLGWKPKTSLVDALAATYRYFLHMEHECEGGGRLSTTCAGADMEQTV